MRYLVALRLAALVVVLGFIAFTYAWGEGEESTSTSEMHSQQALNFDFGLSLYKTLSNESSDTNLFFSPYNILTGLSMPYMGARNNTQRLMHEVLHFPDDALTTAEGFQRSMLELTVVPSGKDSLSLSLANSLWLQQNLKLLPDFVSILSRYYQGSLHEVDFKLDSPNARGQINDWVSNNTQHKIVNLLQPNDLSTETRLVLVSAIYFKAAWITPFNVRDTHPAPFTSKGGVVHSTPFMLQTQDYAYLKTPEYSLLELDYVSKEPKPRFSMIILLPQKEEGLFDLEGKLTSQELIAAFKNMKPARIDLHMPQFKMTEAVALKDALSKLGLSEIFDNNADFSGITGQKELTISDVLHQAYINVDEAGTEAAAATATIMARTSAYLKKPIEFKVNRPFLFLIREKESNEILFIGRMVTPAS